MTQESTFASNLASDKSSRLAEYRRRSQPVEGITIPKSAIDEYKDKGWELKRLTKSGARMFRARSHDENLENNIWSILYHLGYEELNIGRNFKISVIEQNEKAIQKQVDVFARDNNTIVVAECKSNLKMSGRSLQKDLAEFENNKGAIARSIRKHYGSNWKPKIIWLFVTRNVRWSKEDLDRAQQYKIHTLRDNEIRYFNEISRVLGSAARYQFHSEFLGFEKIPALQNRKVPAIKIKLGGRTAYNFSVTPDELMAVSFVNHRDLRDPAGSPTYQRLIRPGRLRSIAAFLDNGGYFPNSIIVSFKRKPRFDLSHPQDERGIQMGHLELPDRYKTC